MKARVSWRLGAQARRLEKVALSELPALLSDWVNVHHLAVGVFRERLFTLSRTFWLFLHQVLTGSSCSEVVSKALSRLGLEEGQIASLSTSAFCQARGRLPQQLVEGVLDEVRQRLEEEGDGWQWHGRVVKVVDGSSVSMPDTADNQVAYPQPARQGEGCGFPVMRLVALFSLATGALLRCERGSLGNHERTLWRRLWPSLVTGDVVLADRGFCGFADYALLLRQGVDCVMRLHAKRGAGVREVERLGRGDWLVEWEKSKSAQRPEWLSEAEWDALPGRLRVRHVSFTVTAAGFRSQSFTIATTLLDPRLYPARDFADLYRRRWMAELFLRDIKVSLGMDPLRCKSSEMVVKELTVHFIAYNLIRALMMTAALEYPIEPTALSFKKSLATIRQWAPAMVEAQREQRHFEMLKLLLYYLAQSIIEARPGRSEPRARKRRPKNYQLLNKPRHIFKEIRHRNRYQNALS